MSRTIHKPKGFGGMSPEVKDEQNRKARSDKRKLSELTLDDCLSYQTVNIDGDYYDCEVLEEPHEILDLGNDKKYKKQANTGFAFS